MHESVAENIFPGCGVKSYFPMILHIFIMHCSEVAIVLGNVSSSAAVQNDDFSLIFGHTSGADESLCQVSRSCS